MTEKSQHIPREAVVSAQIDVRSPKVLDSERIELPYLLVLFCLPSYVDEKARRYIDRLWAKDLVEHTRYIARLSLVTPCRSEQPPNGYVAVDAFPELAKVVWVDVPSPRSMLQAIAKLPSTVSILWRQLGVARVVHSGVAAWPIPEAWILTLLMLFRPRFHLIIVESAFWRLMPGSSHSWKQRLRAGVTEYLNRICLRRADLAIYTQEEYRRSLPPKRFDLGNVIHASWIDEDVILSKDELQLAQRVKLNVGVEPIRVAFAGRLTEAKGILILLRAVEELAIEGLPIELSLLGEGELEESCREASSRMPEGARIQLCGSVPYGEQFFAWLRQAQLVVVPSVSDEQPRIVYDAYSQGLPVIASGTAGLLECVADGITGKIVPPGDIAALKEAIRWAADNPRKLADMGVSAIQRAQGMTHQFMHRTRLGILNAALSRAEKYFRPQ